MAVRVLPEGRRTSRLVVVAEAPAGAELRLGRPLVGPSGEKWMRWLAAVGLQRTDCWIDNVYPYGAPKWKIANVPPDELAPYIAGMLARIWAAVEEPWVLVPMGNVALQALTGREGITKWRGSILAVEGPGGRQVKCIPVLHPAALFEQPHWEARCRADWARIADELRAGPTITLPEREHIIRPRLADLDTFAGDVIVPSSLLAVDIEAPRERTVTPAIATWACNGCGDKGETTNTAAFVREQRAGPPAPGLTQADLDARAPGWRVVDGYAPPKKGAKKPPWMVLHQGAAGACGPVTTDALTKAGKPRSLRPTITWGDARIVCVGVAPSPAVSMTVPTTLAYWHSEANLRRVWEWIARMLALPIAKTLQNGLFDSFFFAADHNLHLTNWRWDTMAMHHLLDPSEEHSLAYLASIFTREPYWKDDTKWGDDLGERLASGDLDTFYRYNGKDACVTHELTPYFEGMLAQRHLLDGYDHDYRQLFPPLLAMMLGGLRVDGARRAERAAALAADLATTRTTIATIAGIDLFGAKGSVSRTKLATYLYETLKLPKQFSKQARKEGRLAVTTDKVAIRRLQLRYPEKVGPFAEAMQGFVRKDKLAQFYAPQKVDPDGRMRCAYKPTTDAWRLASSKSPRRTGDNLQNQDREARDIFLPDDGHLWLKLDLAQIENRIWAMWAAQLGHPRLVERALAPPWEWNEHEHNATLLFGRSIKKHADPIEYRVAKETTHGVERGMGGATLSGRLLTQAGIVRAPEECQRYLDTLKRAEPALDDYFRWVRRRLLVDKALTNSWGRTLFFTWDRMEEATYARGYSFFMQSDAALLLDRCGLVPMWRYLRARGLQSRLLAQVHDELGFSVPPSEAWEVMEAARRSLEQTVTIAGQPFHAYAEVSIGTTWQTEIEWARPPEREEFEAAVRRLAA